MAAKHLQKRIGSLNPHSTASVQKLNPEKSIELDNALDILTANKERWARLAINEKIAILDEVKADLTQVKGEWIRASIQAKGNQDFTPQGGEEWASVTIIFRLLRYLRLSLESIKRSGVPMTPPRVRTRAEGALAVEVLPLDTFDKLTFVGIRAEVWLDPSDKDKGVSQGAFYRQESPEGAVVFVIGAGNVSTIAPVDLLHKLYVEGAVVLLKLSPVNDYLAASMQKAFNALIRRGFLRIVSGDVAESAYLVDHPRVDELHLTGSDATYEKIVFGKGEAGQRRKVERDPLVIKPFSAELGNITPVIVVPGPWSEIDIRKQALKLSSWLVPNAGFNCTTPRMIIQQRSWVGREKLNHAIAESLNQIPNRAAYYPGSTDLHAGFIQAHPEAQRLGAPTEGQLPWTFIPGLDPDDADEICFSSEPFLGLFSETALEAAEPVEFIQKAVAFANQRLWGTLSASIVVHPKSMEDPKIAAAVDQAISDLRYGTVLVNQWGAVSYYLTLTPWGGYPGSDPYNIQSGVGFVNNPFMFDDVKKSVVYAPFIAEPDPTSAAALNNYPFYVESTRFEEQRTVGNLVRLVWRAVRS